MKKKISRLRRARRTRAKIRELGGYRLCVHRTPRHIYAQVIAPDGGSVLAAASTLQKDLINELESTGNIEAAKAVGKAIAVRAQEAGVEKVVFDRNGYPYHGKVKAFAEGAREAGLKF